MSKPESDESYVDRLNLQFSLHELSNDEKDTCDMLVNSCEASDLLVMPTHGVNEMGSLQGFKYSVPAKSPSVNLPLTHNTFFGHTVTEVQGLGTQVNMDIIRLLSDLDGCREKMKEFMLEVRTVNLMLINSIIFFDILHILSIKE